jgi:hypothetical protein
MSLIERCLLREVPMYLIAGLLIKWCKSCKYGVKIEKVIHVALDELITTVYEVYISPGKNEWQY